jgi:hypothetical protein
MTIKPKPKQPKRTTPKSKPKLIVVNRSPYIETLVREAMQVLAPSPNSSRLTSGR